MRASVACLNSDFAKKMGKETMEEYRAFVKQQLFDGRHGGALNHAKDMILGQLADAAEGEIPSILVENAYQQQMQVIQQQLQMQRMSLTTYLSQIHETRESLLPRCVPPQKRTPAPAWHCCRSHSRRTCCPLTRRSTSSC